MLTMLCDYWISCTRNLQSLSWTPLYDCMKHIVIKQVYWRCYKIRGIPTKEIVGWYGKLSRLGDICEDILMVAL